MTPRRFPGTDMPAGLLLGLVAIGLGTGLVASLVALVAHAWRSRAARRVSS